MGLSSTRAIVRALPRHVLAALTLAMRNGVAVGLAIEDGEVLQQLQDSGVPARLLGALAPFQRKGVLFAKKNSGRCFIADEVHMH